MSLSPTMTAVRERLSRAQSVTVLTGAGISADSGVPTFRGADGLWRNFRAEDLATPEAFARNPHLVWEWYDWRRSIIAGARPNAAHEALARLEQRTERSWLITQNVDGLHRAAGSTRLSEIHGNIWTVRCTACRRVEENHDVPLTLLPMCRHCGALLRPHIVWFGEPLDREDLEQSYRAVGACDVFLIIGTSGIVYPAAAFAPAAKAAGAFVVEVNLETVGDHGIADVSLHGRAKDVVPALLD